jgi:hypothetical protein
MVSSAATSNLDGSDMGVRYFTKDELRALFTLENPYESVTQQQLHVQNASRRHTDAELDDHLQFLSTMSNFYGVSDHNLLFDKESEKQSREEEKQGSARDGSEHSVDKGKEEVDTDNYNNNNNNNNNNDGENGDNNNGDALDRSVIDTVMNDISVVLDDDELQNRSMLADSSSTEEMGLRLQGLCLTTPSPVKKKVPRKQEGPEIHYRGAAVGKKERVSAPVVEAPPFPPAVAMRDMELMIDRAKQSEQNNDLVDALDTYLDVFELLSETHPARSQVTQKVLFLRKSIGKQPEQEGEVELFDDESDLPISGKNMVIDSPIEQLRQTESESKLCVVCM